MDDTTQGVSFWKRPEGKAGYAVLAALVIPITIGIVKFFPYLIEAVADIYKLGGMLLGLFVIVQIARSNLAWYAFQTVSRMIAGMFVDLDPVGIMKAFLKFALEQRAQLVDAIASVMGAKKNLDDQRQSNERLKKSYQGQAQAGIDLHKRAGTSADDDLEVNAALENAASIQNVNEELAQLSADLEGGITDLQEALKRVDYEISRTRTDVNLEEQRYKAAMAIGVANKKMGAVLGANNRRDMYDMATERVRTVYSQKRAVLSVLVETSRSAAGSIDLQKRALRNQGLSQLKQQIGSMAGEGLGLITAGSTAADPARAGGDPALAAFLDNPKK